MFDSLPMLSWVTFGISLTSISIIFAISIRAAYSESFQFFPPPSKQSWQHGTFLMLFRFFVFPLIALSVIEFEPEPNAWIRYVIGIVLLATGFGSAFLITFQMGWRNAFGERHGLMTEGWFRYSRNHACDLRVVTAHEWPKLAAASAEIFDRLVCLCSRDVYQFLQHHCFPNTFKYPPFIENKVNAIDGLTRFILKPDLS